MKKTTQLTRMLMGIGYKQHLLCLPTVIGNEFSYYVSCSNNIAQQKLNHQINQSAGFLQYSGFAQPHLLTKKLKLQCMFDYFMIVCPSNNVKFRIFRKSD
jgi:hypothetical protein